MKCCAYTRILLSKTARRYICIILIILELVCFFVGISLVACGIIVLIYFKNYENLIINHISENFPIFLIITGSIMLIQHLIGLKIINVNLEWRQLFRQRFFYQGLTYFYLALSLMGLILYLFAGSLCLVYRPQMTHAFKSAFLDAMTLYGSNLEKKLIVDKIQIEFECCGGEKFSDWMVIPWISKEYTHNSEMSKIKFHRNFFLSSSVPFSCCNPKSPRPCIHRLVDNEDVHYHYDRDKNLTLFRGGCGNKMTLWMNEFLLKYIGQAILYFIILEIIMIIIFRYMHTSNDIAMSWGLPNITAPGYFFLLGPTPVPPDDVSMDPKDLDERLNNLKDLVNKDTNGINNQKIITTNNLEMNTNDLNNTEMSYSNKNVKNSSSTNCNYSNSTNNQFNNYPASYISTTPSFDLICTEYSSGKNSSIKKTAKNSKSSKTMDEYTNYVLCSPPYTDLMNTTTDCFNTIFNDNVFNKKSLVNHKDVLTEFPRDNICFNTNKSLNKSTKQIIKNSKNNSNSEAQLKYKNKDKIISLVNNIDYSKRFNSFGKYKNILQKNNYKKLFTKSATKNKLIVNSQDRVKCELNIKHNVSSDSVTNKLFTDNNKSNIKSRIINFNDKSKTKTNNSTNKVDDEGEYKILKPNYLITDSAIIKSYTDTDNSYTTSQVKNSGNRSTLKGNSNIYHNILLKNTNDIKYVSKSDSKMLTEPLQYTLDYGNKTKSNINTDLCNLNESEFCSSNNTMIKYRIKADNEDVLLSRNNSIAIQVYSPKENDCILNSEKLLDYNKAIQSNELDLNGCLIDNYDLPDFNSSNICSNDDKEEEHTIYKEKLDRSVSSNDSPAIKSDFNFVDSNEVHFGSEFSNSRQSILDGNFNNSNFNSTYISQYTSKFELDSSFSMTIDSSDSRYNLIRDDAKLEKIGKMSKLRNKNLQNSSIVNSKESEVEEQLWEEWAYAQQFSTDPYLSYPYYYSANEDRSKSFDIINKKLCDVSNTGKKANANQNNNEMLINMETNIQSINGTKHTIQGKQDLYLHGKHSRLKEANIQDIYAHQEVIPIFPTNPYYFHYKYQSRYYPQTPFMNQMQFPGGSIIVPHALIPTNVLQVDPEIFYISKNDKKCFEGVGERTDVKDDFVIHSGSKAKENVSLVCESNYRIGNERENMNCSKIYENKDSNECKVYDENYEQCMDADRKTKEKKKKDKKDKNKEFKHKERKRELMDVENRSCKYNWENKYKHMKNKVKNKELKEDTDLDKDKNENKCNNKNKIFKNKEPKEKDLNKGFKKEKRLKKPDKHKKRKSKCKKRKKMEKGISKKKKDKNKVKVFDSKSKKDRKRDKKKKYKRKLNEMDRRKREKKRKKKKVPTATLR